MLKAPKRPLHPQGGMSLLMLVGAGVVDGLPLLLLGLGDGGDGGSVEVGMAVVVYGP